MAEVPGNPIQDSLAKIVVRRRGEDADFAAVLELVPEGGKALVRAVRAVPGGLELVSAGSRRTITLPEAQPADAPPHPR